VNDSEDANAQHCPTKRQTNSVLQRLPVNRCKTCCNDHNGQYKPANAEQRRTGCIEKSTQRPRELDVNRDRQQNAETDECNAAKFVTATLKDRLQYRRATLATTRKTKGLNFVLFYMCVAAHDLGTWTRP
jgi:hypothetical protein